MNDTTKPPAQPPIKDAVPDGKEDAAPLVKQLTFTQQLFIWTMVAIVGVVFGVGASFSLVFAPTQTIAGIAEGEVIKRMQVAERMERVLVPNGNPYQRKFSQPPWVENPLEAYASDLRLARVGESRNLMPKGAALERIEQDFLATPLDGSQGRTYLDALREHEGGNDQVAREDLRRYLAERAARDSLYLRSAIAPAVPRAVAADMVSVRGDRAEVAEVVLSGARFISEVKADDPEIASTYERLRGTRFTRPASVGLAVAWANRDTLGAAIEVSDADAKSWYDGHKDQFLGDPDPKDPSKAPEAKPFDAVKADVVAKIRAERGTTQAQTLVDTFNLRAEELEAEKDPAKFRASASESKLQVSDVSVENSTPGTVNLGVLGTVKDVMRLFGRDHDVGFISQPLVTSAGHVIIMRLESRREPGFQELDAVRPEVIRHVAGRRAWKSLLAEAATLKTELDGKGPGALAAWSTSEAAKPWNATLSNTPQALSTKLTPPPAEADGQPGDAILVASLAMSARPLAIVSAEPAWEGDVPRIRLVQVGDLKPASRDGLAEGPLADAYRGALRRFGLSIFDREIQSQLEAR